MHQVARLVGSEGVLRKTLSCVFGVGVAVALAACDGPKHAECEKLMGVINRGLDQIETSQQQLKNNPDRTVELRAMADALEKLATEAGAVSLETPELRELSGRYQKMAKEAALHARALADAEKEKKLEEVKKAKNSLNETFKLEDPIVLDLNKTCAR